MKDGQFYGDVWLTENQYVEISDILDKSKASEGFYLVNRGAIINWKCEHRFNDFCMYKWDK